jgi:hypothetical protein
MQKFDILAEFDRVAQFVEWGDIFADLAKSISTKKYLHLAKMDDGGAYYYIDADVDSLQFMTMSPNTDIISYIDRICAFMAEQDETVNIFSVFANAAYILLRLGFMGYLLCDATAHKFIGISLLLSYKLLTDSPLKNRSFVNVLGIRLREINRLEILCIAMTGASIYLNFERAIILSMYYFDQKNIDCIDYAAHGLIYKVKYENLGDLIMGDVAICYA